MGLEKLTNGFGLMTMFRGGAAMAGPPLAGKFIQITHSKRGSDNVLLKRSDTTWLPCIKQKKKLLCTWFFFIYWLYFLDCLHFLCGSHLNMLANVSTSYFTIFPCDVVCGESHGSCQGARTHLLVTCLQGLCTTKHPPTMLPSTWEEPCWLWEPCVTWPCTCHARSRNNRSRRSASTGKSCRPLTAKRAPCCQSLSLSRRYQRVCKCLECHTECHEPSESEFYSWRD